MARVRDGDRAAFAVLARRHARGVARFAQRMLRDAGEADDVAQDTLLRVWQHAARWEADRVRFRTWLYTIANNACIDRLRTRARRPVEHASASNLRDVQLAPATTVSLERSVWSRDAGIRLERALERLPERQRSALVLCFYQGFANRDAAAMLGVGVEALESLLSRARRALRRDLADTLAELHTGSERDA